MSTEEVNRLMLATRATEAMGKEAATVLMDHLPMGGISRLSTKDDLVLMRAEFHTDIAELRTVIAELRTEVKTDITELRTEVKTDIAELRTELYKSLNAQTMKFITVMSAINALMFAGLKWG